MIARHDPDQQSFMKRQSAQSADATSTRVDWKSGAWLYLVPTTLLLFVLPIDHTTALRMVFLALTAAAAVLFWRTRGVTRIPLLFPFAVCFLVALASLPGAADPWFSFDEIKKELGYGLVVFLAFHSLSRTQRDVSTWIFTILLNLLLMGIYTLYGGLSSRTLEFDGWHGGVLNYSVFVATTFPLLLAALVYPGVSGKWKAVVLILIPLALFTTQLTGNRISWIAIVASTIISAGLYLALKPTGSRARIIVAGSLLLLVVSALAFTMTAKQRIGSQAGVAETLSVTAETDPRNRIWAYSIQRIKEKPLMGTGFGRMAQAHEFARHFDNEPLWVHAHNLFLDYGIQMGVPGILAFAFLFICVVREFFRLYRAADPRIALIGIAGIAVLAAVLLKSTTDNQFVRHNALLFWALVGMGLGYGARLGVKPPTPDPSQTEGRYGIPGENSAARSS